MKKKIIVSAVLLVLFSVILTAGYFGVRYTLECKAKLDREEVRWTLEHPDEVKAVKDSYESVHRAADDVFFGILEQGKE